jgi:hypothetical protein
VVLAFVGSAIDGVQQMSIDQLKDFDVTSVARTSEDLSAASHYIVTARDRSEKNDAANFANMLLVCGA